MLGRLFLLFLLVPLADLALLVAIGSRLGLVPTLAVVILTAGAGSWLARREGLRAWTQVRTTLQAGRMPAEAMLDGLLVFAAGVLLLTPGFLTDLAGLVGLLPATRSWIRRRLVQPRMGGIVGEVVGSRARRRASPAGVEDAEVVSETPRHNVASARL